MIRRFDQNNNNMIDPSEAQGPAQFFLQRMAQNNPKIDLSKPVPIDLLSGEMERMRGGSSGSSEGDSSASKEPELLVPDFSLESEPTPIEGFGVTGGLFSVRVEERDRKEAEDRLKRYDQNRDGVLTANELQGGRWSDDPMQYDRNRDGKLTATELAVRYANRRVQDAAMKNGQNQNANDPRSRFAAARGGDSGGWGRGGETGGWGRGGEGDVAPDSASRFGEAKSYRTSSSDKSPSSSGLPDFFSRSDADGDGQVLMSEFSSAWNADTLNEFLKWDLNSDGIITARECLLALESGARVGSSGGTSPPTTSASKPVASSGAIGGTQIEWAQRQISKYDKNGDGVLTAAEWEKMIVKPVGADANGDGTITVEEYAAFREKQ